MSNVTLHGKNVSRSVSRRRPETLFPAGNIRKFRLRNIGKHWETFSYWKHSSSAPWIDDPGARTTSVGRSGQLGRLGRPRLVASGVWLHIRKKMDGHQYQKRSPWLIGDHIPIYLYPHATISNEAQLIDRCPYSFEVSPHKNSNLGSLHAR